MNNKVIIAIIVIVLVVLGGYYLMSNNDQTTSMKDEQSNDAVEPNPDQNNDQMTSREVIYADSGYSPSSLTIKVGDTVTFKNQSSRVKDNARPAVNLNFGREIVLKTNTSCDKLEQLFWPFLESH